MDNQNTKSKVTWRMEHTQSNNEDSGVTCFRKFLFWLLQLQVGLG